MASEMITPLVILGALMCCTLVSGQGIIDGCPSYGCRPSGTFSFSLQPPTNGTVAWKSSVFLGPVPGSLGCVGNANNIICQSNGPREVGYISIDVSTGNLMWRDGILRFPVLPIMDIYGDVIGSDGHSLVFYMDDGSLKPVIHMMNWVYPIFSLSITEDSIFMFVSKNGYIISYFPDGVPHAQIPLPGELEQVNGTFHPISTPVISGRRAYILTQFIPEGQKEPGNLGMQRLYAVDIIPRMVDRLHISWVINFEMETPRRRSSNRGNVVFFDLEDEENTASPVVPPRVMVNPDTDTVYVSLPPPASSNGGVIGTKFWAIKDNQTTSKPEILFKKNYALSSMATYEVGSNGRQQEDRKEGMWKDFGPMRKTGPMWKTADKRETGVNEPPSVWAVDAKKETILEISPSSGNILKSLNVSQLLQAKTVVTSDLMVTRADKNDEDHLVFAATLVNGPSPAFNSLLKSLGCNQSDNKNYVMQLKGGTVEWAMPTVEDLPGIGQIAGIKTHERMGDDMKDLYVVFAGNDESSVVFGIH